MRAGTITTLALMTNLCAAGLVTPAMADDAREVVRIDAAGVHIDIQSARNGPPADPGVGLRDSSIIWHASDPNSITASVALANTVDETWVAHELNGPRLSLHQTSGSGMPLWVSRFADNNPPVVGVASAEDASLGVVITSQDPNTVLLRAYTSADKTPVWTYKFVAAYPSALERSVDVSADGSVVAAVATNQTTGAAQVVILNGATGGFQNSAVFTTNRVAEVELSDDGSRAVLTLGGTATVIDTSTLATLHTFAVSGGGGHHRISRDGTVVAAGGFNYRAYRDTGSGWTQIFNRTAPDNWFGGGLGIAGDGSWMIVVSYNYLTGYLTLTYRMINLTTGTETAQITTTGAGAWQDTVQIAHASADGTRFAVASWGTQDNVHPEVQVFDRDLNRIGELDTPGSVFDIDFSSDGRTLVAGGKAVHANSLGRGRDTYAVRITLDCTGDVNGDGVVDLTDLAVLLSAFDACTGDPLYDPNIDIDGSGCIDLTDLAVLLSHFDEVCG